MGKSKYPSPEHKTNTEETPTLSFNFSKIILYWLAAVENSKLMFLLQGYIIAINNIKYRNTVF